MIGFGKKSKDWEHLSRKILDKSFRYSEPPGFPLASGRRSNVYIDCKTVLSYPEVRNLIGKEILRQIDVSSLDAVGGLELGAYPIALAVSDEYYRLTGRSLRVFVVRKEPKPHGLQKCVEGDVKPGDQALIVDDVVTTGKSTILAVNRAKEAGLKVVKVVVLVDRQEGGTKNFKTLGVPFEAVFTLRDLREAEAASQV